MVPTILDDLPVSLLLLLTVLFTTFNPLPLLQLELLVALLTTLLLPELLPLLFALLFEFVALLFGV